MYSYMLVVVFCKLLNLSLLTIRLTPKMRNFDFSLEKNGLASNQVFSYDAPHMPCWHAQLPKRSVIKMSA